MAEQSQARSNRIGPRPIPNDLTFLVGHRDSTLIGRGPIRRDREDGCSVLHTSFPTVRVEQLPHAISVPAPDPSRD